MSENKFNYKADLLERLKDRGYAQLYLVAATKESQETFLLALRDVAEAQKGMTQLAVEADVNRENLYRALSEEGNPTLSTLSSVLDVLGMELQPILTKHLAAPAAQPVAPAQPTVFVLKCPRCEFEFTQEGRCKCVCHNSPQHDSLQDALGELERLGRTLQKSPCGQWGHLMVHTHESKGNVICDLCARTATLSATKLESGEPPQQPEVKP